VIGAVPENRTRARRPAEITLAAKKAESARTMISPAAPAVSGLGGGDRLGDQAGRPTR